MGGEISSSINDGVEQVIEILDFIFELFAASAVLFIILSIASAVVSLIMAYVIAEKKGRSGVGWIILTIIFGWIAVVIVSVSVPLNQNYASSTSSANYNTKPTSGYSLTRSANATNVNKTNKTYIQNVTPQDKSGWKCSCGQVNNPNAMRCINCGKERSINHYWNCKSCGKQNSSTSNFCSNCGTQKPN